MTVIERDIHSKSSVKGTREAEQVLLVVGDITASPCTKLKSSMGYTEGLV